MSRTVELTLGILGQLWAFIANAPAAAILLASLAFGCAYILIRLSYYRKVVRLEATNATLKKSLTSHEERIVSLEKIVSLNQTRIGKYRQRLGLPSPDFLDYSQLTDQELQQVALTVVAHMRDMLHHYHDQLGPKAHTVTEALVDYRWEFQGAVTGLQDALIGRVSRTEWNDLKTHPDYKHPRTTEDLEVIATDLEILATRLPRATIVFENQGNASN